MKQKVIGRHDISYEQSLRSITKWVLLYVVVCMLVCIYATIGTVQVVWPFIFGVPVIFVFILIIQYLRAK